MAALSMEKVSILPTGPTYIPNVVYWLDEGSSTFSIWVTSNDGTSISKQVSV